MYKEIMGTDAGREFTEWLHKEHRVNQYDEKNGFTMDSAYGYEYSIIKESIINNLAIEFLDSKEYKLTIGHYCNVVYHQEDYYYRINDQSNHRKVVGCSGFDSRQEAIAQGVKKGFELLGGE